MTDPPPQVLIKYLVNIANASYPSSSGQWPITYGGTDADTTDNWITVRSVTGWNEGKLHRTGESVIKPRMQIETRSIDHITAEGKLIDICTLLSPIQNIAVVLGTNHYTIHSVSIIVPPAFLMEEEKNLRQIYVATVQLSLSKD